MPKSRKIILKGEQRADADAHVIARVIIMLARQWVERQESQESPIDGREDIATGTARITDKPEAASE